MQTSLFDYYLPQAQIAQYPLSPRDHSKLLVCQAKGRLGDWKSNFSFSHVLFENLPQFLSPQDFLVFNDTKVLPLRLLGQREDGKKGAVEALLIQKISSKEWTALLHLSAKPKLGLRFIFPPGLVAEVASEVKKNTGEVLLKFSGIGLERIPLETWLQKHGHIPLPPYIHREDLPQDQTAYQTVYAKNEGAVAAPTAGLHFTQNLLDALQSHSIEVGFITHYIGIGTFRPIKTTSLQEHQMHEETYEISEKFVQQFEAAKKQKKRIVAVGTTVVRALESWIARGFAGRFSTCLFIQPGFSFQAVDDLITNFHLPKSTLFVLVAAAMGLESAHEAYMLAIKDGYRFYSYGDAMFIRG